MKQVVQTNKCIISLMKRKPVIDYSVIDNLTKDFRTSHTKHEFNVWIG
jgi:hypothetical protein